MWRTYFRLRTRSGLTCRVETSAGSVPDLSTPPSGENKRQSSAQVPAQHAQAPATTTGLIFKACDSRIPALTGRGYNPGRQSGDSVANEVTGTRY